MQLPDLSGLQALTGLDVAYNRLTSIEALTSLPAGTKDLYLSSNKLSSLEVRLQQILMLQTHAQQMLQSSGRTRSMWLEQSITQH